MIFCLKYLIRMNEHKRFYLQINEDIFWDSIKSKGTKEERDKQTNKYENP